MASSKTAVNLHKKVKRVMATILDPNARSIYKRAMIGAEISYMAGKNRKFSDPASSQRPRTDRETPKD